MQQQAFDIGDEYDYRGFGADRTNIFDERGEFYSWQQLATLRGKYLVSDIDMFAAHLIRQNAPIHILSNKSATIIKISLNKAEFVSLQRFGYPVSTGSGEYGAKCSSELRRWLAANDWRLRTSLGSTGLYDVLPIFLGEKKIGRNAIWLQEWRAKKLATLSLAGREYAEAGIYHAYSYDINSAYGAIAATTALPYPPRMRIINPDTIGKSLYYIRLYNGALKCAIRLPSDRYGLLPTKTADGLNWNQQGGLVRGVYTTNEIRYALECGASLVGVDWLMYSTTNGDYLAPFVQAAYEEKLAAEQDRDVTGRRFWKLLINGTIGRFAASGDLFTCERLPYGVPVTAKPPRGYSGFLPIDLDTIFLTKPFRYKSAGSNRLWTAIIVSEQRCQLHREATRCNAIYCDTDSIVSLQDCSTILNIGDGLGQWNSVGNGKITIRGAKQYASDWSRAKARGIPAAVAESFVLGEQVTFSRRRSWRADALGDSLTITTEARKRL